jgi:phage/conjugal plasmid C-4 type zinc finger TraR family protein
MPDEMDLVQERAEEFNATALELQLQYRRTGASLKTCCVCGGDIPEARRLAMPGCIKCIECQSEWESMHAPYRG